MRRFVLAAVESEIDRVLDVLGAGPEADSRGCRVYAGRFGRHPVGCCVVGVGVAQAALSIGNLLSRYPIREALFIGSAGAFPGSGLQVGDLAVADSEAFAEFGVCVEKGIGDAGALDLEGIQSLIPFDRPLGEALLKAAGKACRARSGALLTVAGVSPDPDLARNRALCFGAVAENMEGYALALAARSTGIRAGEIRGISNIAGMRDRGKWDLDLALGRCQEALLEYLGQAPWYD